LFKKIKYLWLSGPGSEAGTAECWKIDFEKQPRPAKVNAYGLKAGTAL